jgi:transposase
MTRLRGRAPCGERVVEHAPHGHWHTTTMISAIRLTGVEAPMVINGAMDSLVFRGYIERMLAPTLHAGDIVVMDNLSSHKTAGVREAVEAVDASLLYLPPYSPDFNPIEAMWSKVKQSLRSAAARNSHALLKAIGNALHSVTLEDCRGFFHGCGYNATQ